MKKSAHSPRLVLFSLLVFFSGFCLPRPVTKTSYFLPAALEKGFYFLTDTGVDDGKTPHTLSANSHFYSAVQDGSLYKDRLRDGVINDRPYSVGKEFLSSSGEK